MDPSSIDRLKRMSKPDIVQIEVHGISHVGRVRRANQDHFLIGRIHKVLDLVDSNLTDETRVRVDRTRSPILGHLLVVADGVGGSAGGEEASNAAVDGLVSYVIGRMPRFVDAADAAPLEKLLRQFQMAVAASHDRVREEAARVPHHQDMATTLTAAYLDSDRAYIFHVGDSRGYLLRGGKIERITRDQTYAQDLVDRGVWTQDVADGSTLARYLSSAVGGSEHHPEALVYDLPLDPADALVLCSDGLTKHLRDTEIADIVGAAESAEAACAKLVETALEAGGSDNITVIVARIG